MAARDRRGDDPAPRHLPNFKVACCTWNVHAFSAPTDIDLAPWLLGLTAKSSKPHLPEHHKQGQFASKELEIGLIAVSLQEILELNNPSTYVLANKSKVAASNWTGHILTTLNTFFSLGSDNGNSFEVLQSISNVGVALIVLCRRQLIARISQICFGKSNATTYVGNKGGTAVRFLLDSKKTFCFVAVHLTAKEGKDDQRNKDLRVILTRLPWKSEDQDVIKISGALKKGTLPTELEPTTLNDDEFFSMTAPEENPPVMNSNRPNSQGSKLLSFSQVPRGTGSASLGSSSKAKNASPVNNTTTTMRSKVGPPMNIQPNTTSEDRNQTQIKQQVMRKEEPSASRKMRPAFRNNNKTLIPDIDKNLMRTSAASSTSKQSKTRDKSQIIHNAQKKKKDERDNNTLLSSMRKVFSNSGSSSIPTAIDGSTQGFKVTRRHDKSNKSKGLIISTDSQSMMHDELDDNESVLDSSANHELSNNFANEPRNTRMNTINFANVPRNTNILAKNVRLNQQLLDHDVVFVFGDMNYRCDHPDLSFDEILELIKEEKYEHIMSHYDHMKKNFSIEHTFSWFKEMEVDFPPTYKFSDSNPNEYARKKGRTPSYTDRILFKNTSNFDLVVEPLVYDSCPQYVESDHKPVFAQFNILS